MFIVNRTYKANIDGVMTVEDQISRAEHDSITNGSFIKKDFEKALKYWITKTIIDVFGNAVITYQGQKTTLSDSLQRNLVKIYFHMHDKGECYVKIDESTSIVDVNTYGGIGYKKLVDQAKLITGVTQRVAAEKELSMYDLVCNANFSVLDERGMLGVFSPKAGVDIKNSAISVLEDKFKNLFGITSNKKKIALVNIPMDFSGINLPVKDLALLENKKEALASVARIYGINENMVLPGQTYDNLNNAIALTYSNFAGVIYNYLTQIENQLISMRDINQYNVSFPNVKQTLTVPTAQPIV